MINDEIMRAHGWTTEIVPNTKWADAADGRTTILGREGPLQNKAE